MIRIKSPQLYRLSYQPKFTLFTERFTGKLHTKNSLRSGHCARGVHAVDSVGSTRAPARVSTGFLLLTARGALGGG